MLDIEKNADLIREILLEGAFQDAEGEEVEGSPELLGLSQNRFQALSQELNLAPDTELDFYLKHLAPKHECMCDAALGSYGLTFLEQHQIEASEKGLQICEDPPLYFELPSDSRTSSVSLIHESAAEKMPVANSIEQFFRMLRYSWVLLDSEAHIEATSLDVDDQPAHIAHLKTVVPQIEAVVPGCSKPWVQAMTIWDIDGIWDQIKPTS